MKKDDKIVCIKDIIEKKSLPEFRKSIQKTNRKITQKIFDITKKYPEPRTPEQSTEVHKVFSECEKVAKKQEKCYYNVKTFTNGQIYKINDDFLGEIEIIGNDGEAKDFLTYQSMSWPYGTEPEAEPEPLSNINEYFITLIESRKRKLKELKFLV